MLVWAIVVILATATKLVVTSGTGIRPDKWITNPENVIKMFVKKTLDVIQKDGNSYYDQRLCTKTYELKQEFAGVCEYAKHVALNNPLNAKRDIRELAFNDIGVTKPKCESIPIKIEFSNPRKWNEAEIIKKDFPQIPVKDEIITRKFRQQVVKCPVGKEKAFAISKVSIEAPLDCFFFYKPSQSGSSDGQYFSPQIFGCREDEIRKQVNAYTKKVEDRTQKSVIHQSGTQKTDVPASRKGSPERGRSSSKDGSGYSGISVSTKSGITPKGSNPSSRRDG